MNIVWNPEIIERQQAGLKWEQTEFQRFKNNNFDFCREAIIYFLDKSDEHVFNNFANWNEGRTTDLSRTVDLVNIICEHMNNKEDCWKDRHTYIQLKAMSEHPVS